MDVTSVSQATAISAADTAKRTLAERFDNFLTLLTKQLQHQDPLNPLDSTEFVAQLVSFTEVEQSIATNKNLESLAGILQSTQTMTMLNFLGQTVEASGATAGLRNGQATYSYTLPRTAQSSVITITDAGGKKVYQTSGALTAGRSEFVWDGKDANGVAQPDGPYTISVTAKDAAGESMTATTTVQGRVSGIEQTSSGIVLDVDGVRTPLASILAVREPPGSS
jgi:flagellar basal-body rod modification protein FlgD